MSHFSKLKVMVKNLKLASAVAAERGWTTTKQQEFVNPWLAAKEKVVDCTVFYDSAGKAKLVVDSRGNVIHDAWSMGREAYSFMQDYSEKFIRKTAAAEGAMVTSKGVDAAGCRVLEIEYC